MKSYYCKKCGMSVGSQYKFCTICGTSTFVSVGKKSEKSSSGSYHLPDYTCESCYVTFSSEHEFKGHLNLIHICQICNQKFNTQKEKDKHYNLHLKCKYCNVQCNTKEELIEHKKSEHFYLYIRGL